MSSPVGHAVTAGKVELMYLEAKKYMGFEKSRAEKI
jgi:hypothetical protein